MPLAIGSRSAFGQGESRPRPVDGVAIHKNVDTVNVLAVGALYRNVPVVPPLTIEQVSEGDTVALFWDSTDKPSVIAVLGHQGARASDARLDTTPPPAPMMLRVVQDAVSGPFLTWIIPPGSSDIAYFEVDARQPGGSWGYGKYPFSEGMSRVHFPRYNVPVQCRVRSVDLRGNTSAWAVCADLLIDQVAPPVPAGLGATGTVDGVQLTWTGPTPLEAKDLAGFEVYRSLESDGSDAEMVKRVGPTLSTSVPCEGGVTYYFNLKAFDLAGNVSDYGPVWAEAWAEPPGQMQLLVNSDFSRDKDGDGEPDQWSIVALPRTTVTYGDYGAHGGKGFEIHLEDGAYTQAAFRQVYRSGYDYPLIPPLVGFTYVMTAYVKTTWPNWTLQKDGLLLDGYLLLRCSLLVSNGSAVEEVTADADGMIIEENAWSDGWYRIRFACTLTQEDLELVSPDATSVGYEMRIGIGVPGEWLDVYFDRVQMETGSATPWQPSIVPPGGTDGASSFGLLMDTSGIKTEGGEFFLSSDGLLYSPLALHELTSAPSSPAADTEAQIFLWRSPTHDYRYLVIAHLDGATARYNYLRLDAASPSWEYGTSLPDP